MPQANAYAPEQVRLTLDGELIEGFMEGDFLTISQPEDGASISRGTHGEQTFNQRLIYDATATITLHGGSSANSTLQLLLDQQRESGSFSFTFDLVDVLATDKRSTSPACKITKRPDMTFGNEISSVEWVIIMSNATIRHSGRIPL